VRAERDIRRRFEASSDAPDETEVRRQLMDLLTGSYSLAYERYFFGNEFSARHRTWALRLVLAALLCLIASFLLLPLHTAR